MCAIQCGKSQVVVMTSLKLGNFQSQGQALSHDVTQTPSILNNVISKAA